MLTDSGGLQEETTALGIPCLTLRENTERPVTVEEGTNTIVGNYPKTIISSAFEALDGEGKSQSDSTLVGREYGIQNSRYLGRIH